MRIGYEYLNGVESQNQKIGLYVSYLKDEKKDVVDIIKYIINYLDSDKNLQFYNERQKNHSNHENHNGIDAKEFNQANGYNDSVSHSSKGSIDDLVSNRFYMGKNPEHFKRIILKDNTRKNLNEYEDLIVSYLSSDYIVDYLGYRFIHYLFKDNSGSGIIRMIATKNQLEDNSISILSEIDNLYENIISIYKRTTSRTEV